MDDDAGPFVPGRQLPPGFELSVVTVAPGTRRPYDDAEWRDALVLVRHGEIELETLAGARRRFGCGDLLCLTVLSLRALHNPGPRPSVLVAISRRAIPGPMVRCPPAGRSR
jgi:hypothetical protein